MAKKHTTAEPKKRRDKEYNHELIYNAYIKIAKNKMKIPTFVELSEETGLCVKTIDRHLKELSFEKQKEKMRIFTEATLFQVAKNAMSGKSVQWCTLYFELMEGLNAKQVQAKATTPEGTELEITMDI